MIGELIRESQTSYQHLILAAGTEQYQPTSICYTMTNQILQITKHTAKMLSVVMLLSFLTVASKAEIPDPIIISAENTIPTVVAEAEFSETSTISSKNSGNCECLSSASCTDLLSNCVGTAQEAYDNGDYSDEIYEMFVLGICPDAFTSCWLAEEIRRINLMFQ